MKDKTKACVVATFIGVLVSVVAFAIIIVIGGYLGQDWNLLYQGEGVPLIGNLFAIGIPAFLGAYFAQSVD